MDIFVFSVTAQMRHRENILRLISLLNPDFYAINNLKNIFLKFRKKTLKWSNNSAEIIRIIFSKTSWQNSSLGFFFY